jgi:hypothetical protein
MIGYAKNTKGYRLWNPFTDEIITRTSVKFDETRLYKDLDAGKSYVKMLKEMEETKRTRLNDRKTGAVIRIRLPACTVQISERVNEPTTLAEAMTSPDKELWRQAILSEHNSLLELGVFQSVPRPISLTDKELMKSKYVFKVKYNPDHSIDKYKVRLVAKGYSQLRGINYLETFSPVISQPALRLVLLIGLKMDWPIHHIDIKTAYLYGPIDCDLYMHTPEGFPKRQGEVMKLLKGLPGTKQGGRNWNIEFKRQLKRVGFNCISSEQSIFVKYNKLNEPICICTVYVDDIVITGEPEEIKRIKDYARSKWQIVDNSDVHHLLGMRVQQTLEAIHLDQAHYVDKILEEFNMTYCAPVSTPSEPRSKLQPAEPEEERANQLEYRKAVGALMYLALLTRPDIMYSVNQLARFCNDPSKTHWTAAKRLLRYLKGTHEYGLTLKKPTSKTMGIHGFTDADGGGEKDTGKSTSGVLVKIGDSAIAWTSTRQKAVALSTLEAEYMAACNGSKTCLWLRNVIRDLKINEDLPILLLIDNQGAIDFSKNGRSSSRSRHIDLQEFFLWSLYEQGTVDLRHVRTNDQLADIMTKSLPRPAFEELREQIGVTLFRGEVLEQSEIELPDMVKEMRLDP